MLGKPSRRVRKKLEEHGVHAFAEVLEVSRRGMTVTHGNDEIVANTEVVLKLRLRVDPTAEASFELSTRLRFSQFALPAVGQRLAVLFDPDDHESLMLDPAALGGTTLMSGNGNGNALDLGAVLSSVRTAKAGANGDRHAMAELLREQLGASALVVEAAGAPGPPEDPISLLSKLSDLRDKGVLSDEEFEAQKRRILG